ncbi:hypothetical protein SUDANB176_06115 [Streptomyces sp. enrichment culture]|uniref:lysine 5,6-aminomutase reactivase subunit KamB n=1 Tax=Streptomyces sp. enrichment culture TaxID=1795815 RepID=UPI003F5520D0
MSRLTDLVADAPRIAVAGMAKNTGKTRTLVTLLTDLHRRGRTTGVTSIGRDGEDHDVIDPRITKPRIRIPPGGLVTTTEPLLRERSVSYERLFRGGRTPLGHVVICRLPSGGEVEVAGPSSAAETARVCQAMLDLGADNVLIDGAINRRAAASPSVADAMVLATGAALHPSTEQVVARTAEAVHVFRLPQAPAQPPATRSRAVLDTGEHVELSRRLTLGQAPHEVEKLFAGPGVRHLVLAGALCEPLVEQVGRAARGRRISLVVQDSTRVFLSERTCSWYQRRNVFITVLRRTRLAAVTINPVAPGSHRLDSEDLRRQISAALPGVPVCDVVNGAG